MAENKGTPHVDKGGASPVLHIAGQSQLPEEFIKVGKEYDDALGKAILRDEDQRNALTLTKAWLIRHHHPEQIAILTSWLQGSPAIGGLNRNQATMAYTGVVLQEGMGLKMSKESIKASKELREERAKTLERK